MAFTRVATRHGPLPLHVVVDGGVTQDGLVAEIVKVRGLGTILVASRCLVFLIVEFPFDSQVVVRMKLMNP